MQRLSHCELGLLAYLCRSRIFLLTRGLVGMKKEPDRKNYALWSGGSRGGKKGDDETARLSRDMPDSTLQEGGMNIRILLETRKMLTPAWETKGWAKKERNGGRSRGNKSGTFRATAVSSGREPGNYREINNLRRPGIG